MARDIVSGMNNLRAKREAAGLTLDDVIYELRRRLGPLAPKASTLSRWETGKNAGYEDDPLAVIALADLYRVKVADLSPTTANQLDTLRTLLLAATGWLTVDYVAA